MKNSIHENIVFLELMEFFLKVSIGKIVTGRAPAVLEYWSHRS